MGLVFKILLVITIGFSVLKVYSDRRGFTLNETIEHLLLEKLKRDNKKTINRTKLRKIEKPKYKLINKYYIFIENLIIDLNLPLSVENFNSLLLISYIGSMLIIWQIFKSVSVALVTGIPLVIFYVSILIALSRSTRKMKTEKVMMALDLICPMVEDGVAVAIKKASDFIEPPVQYYFKRFTLHYEVQGYSFNDAIDILNDSLGPVFDSFAAKAKTYEFNERRGMKDIFLDIIDDNALRRDINSKKDSAFRKINEALMIKTSLVFIYFLYTLTQPLVRSYFFETTMGKVHLSGTIIIFCLIFAYSQKAQGDIDVD